MMSARPLAGEAGSWLTERLGRVQADLHRRHGDKRFRALIEHSSDMVAIADADSICCYVSPSYERALGYRPEDLLGRPVTTIIHPDDAPRTRQIFAELASDPGGVRWFEARAQHRDQSERWLEVIATNRFDEPIVSGIVVNSRDVTARKAAEERLRKGEERLRLALVAARMGTWNYDIQTGEVTGSEALGAHLGLPPGTPHFSHAAWLERVHPNDQELVAQAARRAIDEGRDYIVEYRFLRPDGSTRWFAERGYVAERDTDGRALTMLGVTADITEGKQTALLRERQARYAALRGEVSRVLATSDSLPGMLQRCVGAIVDHFAAHATIWLLDDQNEVLELVASAGILRHLAEGFSKVPVGRFRVGRIGAERQPYLTNDLAGDRQEGDQDWASRAGMVAFAGHPLLVEDRLVGVLAVFAVEPLAEDSLEALASVADAIAQGIERKRAEEALRASEERLRAILLQIADGVMIADPTGRITFVNDAARRLIGVDETEVALEDFDNTYTALTMEGQPYPLAELPHVRALRDEEPVSGLTMRFRRPDGAEVVVEADAVPVLADDGSRLGAVLTLRDVTARRELERQKDEFFANVSHDCARRSPAIKASIGVVLANEPRHARAAPPHVRQHRRRRRPDGALVDDLLELARLRAGARHAALGRCDLRGLAVRRRGSDRSPGAPGAGSGRGRAAAASRF